MSGKSRTKQNAKARWSPGSERYCSAHGGLASMTRDAIGWRSVVGRVGWRAEERIAGGIGGPLTFGERHALVGRHVGAGLLLPRADQPAVLVRTGEDVVDQLLVVEDPELPPFIEPTGITRRAQRSPDPRQRREH